MPREVSDIKQFIEICRRKDASCMWKFQFHNKASHGAEAKRPQNKALHTNSHIIWFNRWHSGCYIMQPAAFNVIAKRTKSNSKSDAPASSTHWFWKMPRRQISWSRVYLLVRLQIIFKIENGGLIWGIRLLGLTMTDVPKKNKKGKRVAAWGV